MPIKNQAEVACRWFANVFTAN